MKLSTLARAFSILLKCRYIKLTVLGAGEAFDETLGNTCALVKADSTLLLDCGYAAPFQVWQYNADPNLLDGVYISHPHADHYFGLPALLVRMWEDGREKPLALISQQSVLDRVWDLMEYAYAGLRARLNFAIERVPVKMSAPAQWRELRMAFAPTHHSAPNLAMRIENAGKVLVYSGDGMFTEESERLCAKADLVLHEAYKFEPSPVHSDVPQLLAMAERAEIKHLVLTHVQRGVRKHDDRLRDLKASGPVSVAKPGDVFDI